jgi:adenylate kinase
MSQLLRENGDESVQQDILQGKIVDDRVTLAILDADLKAKQAYKKECIVDGWPRALAQAEWLANKVKAGDIMMTGILHLKAHKGVAKERLIHRGRIDDTEEAIIQRFNDYKNTILPILEYLKSQGLPIIEVDADASIGEVEKRVDKAFGI